MCRTPRVHGLHYEHGGSPKLYERGVDASGIRCPGKNLDQGQVRDYRACPTVAVGRDCLALKMVRGSLPGWFALFTGFWSGRQPSYVRRIDTL